MYFKNITSLSLSFVLFFSSFSILANDVEDRIINAKESIQLKKVDEASRVNLDRIINRYADGYQRPAACPLNSTNYSDIVAKINDIKTLFKDNCPAEEATALDQLVNSATQVQGELQTAGVNTSVVPNQVNGQELSSVVSNINDIFLRGKCNFKGGNFLENTADIIFKFSQLGLLVNNSNGLLISGGGLAVSSLLKLISNLFKKKFSFEKTEDRQSFIKLNCAFYDIRRDIENSGFMDVSTDQHRKDLKLIEPLIANIEKNIEHNKKQVESFEKEVKTIEEDYLKVKIPVVYNLVDELNSFKDKVNQKIEGDENTPANAKKLEMIYALMGQRENLITLLNKYESDGLAHAVFMDKLFISELEKLNPANEQINALISMSSDEFNKNFRGNVLFHSSRILKEIEEIKKSELETYYKEIKIDDQTLAEYLKVIRDENKKFIDSEIKELNFSNTSLKKLKRITEGKDFRRDDDGSDNIVAILSDYDNIAEQVYGKWGFEFLKYTSEKSLKLSKTFQRNFKKFTEKYLEKFDNKFVFLSPDHVDELKTLFACQDAKPYRRQWKFAHSLAQEGYDFVATNKELFHSDIHRVFLGFSNSRVGVHNLKSKFEKIQNHQKSSVYANKLLKGEEVDQDLVKRFIKRKKYIGTAMVEVKKQEKQAEILQKLIETYDCSKIVTED